MIYFADEDIFPVIRNDTTEKYFILNYFCGIGVGINISRLYPPKFLLDICRPDDPSFEQAYINYILNNMDAFCDFMEIMMAQYYNQNVIVLTNFNNSSVDTTVSCIIRLIRMRYGCIPYIVHDLDDIIEAKKTDMSSDGTLRFINDKEIYIRETVDPNKLLQNVELVGMENDKRI